MAQSKFNTIIHGAKSLAEKIHEAVVGRNADKFLNHFSVYSIQEIDPCAFVIDLENVWDLLGFDGKIRAMHLLRTRFLQGIDYEIHSSISKEFLTFGDRQETVKVTVDTFKMMCMLVETMQGQEIRTHYLVMEKAILKHIHEIQTTKAKEQEAFAEKAFAQIEEQKVIVEEQKVIVEEQKALVLARDMELQNMNESYVEVIKQDNVYINKAASELHRNAHKVGMTLDSKRREAQLNCAHANETKNVFVQKTSNSKLVEMMVANAIKRYNIGGAGGNEHYNCDIEHTVAIVKISAAVVDTLVSCRSSLRCEGICEVLVSKLLKIKEGHVLSLDTLDRTQEVLPKTSLVLRTPSPLTIPQECRVRTFMSMADIDRKCIMSFGNGGVTSVMDLEKAFAKTMLKRGGHTGRYKFCYKELKLIQSYGCKLSSKAVFVCMTCRQVSKAGCCAAYSQANRRKNMLLFDLSLQML